MNETCNQFTHITNFATEVINSKYSKSKLVSIMLTIAQLIAKFCLNIVTYMIKVRVFFGPVKSWVFYNLSNYYYSIHYF